MENMRMASMEQEEEDEDEEEVEEDGLLPDIAMKEVKEQNKIIWQLYKEAEHERHQNTFRREEEEEEEELQILNNPLALSPGVKHDYMIEDEDEDEDEEDEMEEDVEYKELVPGKHKTMEVKEQNRIIHALYEDSIQDHVPSTYLSATSGASETSVPKATIHHHQLSSTFYPNTATSSTQSLAALDCGGRLEGRLEGLLAQEPSLNKALQLNLALQQNFRSTIASLEEKLRKNQQNQTQIRETLRDSKWSKGDQIQRTDNEVNERPTLRYSHLAVPYFKDGSGMSAPMNEDAKWKIRSGFMDLYTSQGHRWLERERARLTEMVQEKWKKMVVKDKQEKIRSIQREIQALQKMEDIGEEEKNKMLAGLENALSRAENLATEISAIPPDEIPAPCRFTQLDWEEISAQAFDGLRTAKECELQWDNLLHPDINRRPWSNEEDIKIQSWVKIPGTKTDWEAIARRLCTGRTAYLVMQRWVSFLLPTLRPVIWGSKDTRKLLDVVNMLRTGEYIPWSKVQQHLPGFTRAQVYSKWQRINPENYRGHFTPEEDFVLIKGLYLFGLNFNQICHFIPGRSLPQVKRRYKSVFEVHFTTSPWTRKEDDILIKKGNMGRLGWRKLVWDLPRRSTSSMRCRYLTLIFWETMKGPDGEESPPPLFPLTLTTNTEDIERIRSHMIDESPRLKDVLYKSRKKMDSSQIIDELEERRTAFQQRVTDSSAVRIQKIISLKGRPVGSINHTTPSQPLYKELFCQFFAPARMKSPDFPIKDEVMASLGMLSDLLLLRPTHARDPEQQQQQKTGITTYLTDHNLDLLEELVRKQDAWKRGVEDGFYSSDMKLTDIPFIPPNNTTVGAMLSILIHFPVLTEMALGHFIFQNFNSLSLGCMNKSQLSRLPSFQRDSLRLKHSSKEVETEDEAQEKLLKIHITSEGNVKTNKKKMLLRDIQKEKMNTYSKGNKRQSTHGSDHKEASQSAASVQQSHGIEQTPSSASTSSLPQPNPPSPPPPSPPLRETLDTDKTSEQQEEEERLQKARTRADLLLYQRMASLFFWPTVMRLERPLSWQMDMVYRRADQKITEEWMEVKAERQRGSGKSKSKENEEEPEYIAELIRKLREDIAKKQNSSKAPSKGKQTKKTAEGQKKRGRKRKQPLESEHTEEGTPENQEETLQQQQSPPLLPARVENSQSSAPLNTEEVEKNQASSSTNSAYSHIDVVRKKKKVKCLQRSLIMRQVWEARRKGTAPPRKKRQKGNLGYQPRGSRTRATFEDFSD